MGHLVLPGDNTFWSAFSLLDEPSLTITMDDGGNSNTLTSLLLGGTTSVSIASTGHSNEIAQLAENNNVLSTPSESCT
jgi:beta-glucanase (GH16 family)